MIDSRYSLTSLKMVLSPWAEGAEVSGVGEEDEVDDDAVNEEREDDGG